MGANKTVIRYHMLRFREYCPEPMGRLGNQETIKLGKSVVAMYQGERPPTRLPSAITELRISLVPWSHDALSKAIKKAAKKPD